MLSTEKQLFGIAETSRRWGVSTFSVRRLIDSGDLHAINIGARITVPISEILRAEQHGIGKSRKARKSK